MTSSSIPLVKRIIRGAGMESFKALAGECLQRRSTAEVRAAVKAWTAANTPEKH
jgi:phosphoenolpyruvate-protein kinase (PTS system EI component)